jgi:hypothetical protein
VGSATGSSGAGSQGPKIYLVDIENSPSLGWTWGRYETDILKVERDWQLLSFAYKELGRGQVQCIARPDFRDKTDKSLSRAAWGILNSADVVIGHNLDKFDHRKLRAKFVEHRLPPPRPYRTIDTLKVARKHFAFGSNKLNDLAQTLGLGAKVKTGGIELWFACMSGDKAAWRKMVAYNKSDVVLLERVYERLKAWDTTHPNLALYENIPGCPVCSSPRVQRRGMRVNRTTKTPRFQCSDCWHWFSSHAVAKELAAL